MMGTVLRVGGNMSDISIALELAQRFRQEAQQTEWASYSERMLRAAADLEALAREEAEVWPAARKYAG